MFSETREKCLELFDIKAMRNGRAILEGINLSVYNQEIVSIIGPNGAGKSTLLDVITGFLKASSGKILFKDKNITYLPPHKICHLGIARTFQIATPFASLTAIENVMAAMIFGKNLQKTKWLKSYKKTGKKQFDKAMHLLEIVGLPHKATTRANELTLSEQRRLEVARALATDPELLLLDEFAAGLSPQAIENALKLLNDLRSRGLTLLIIDHFLNVTVKASDRLVAMDKGKIIASGSMKEVLEHPTVISAYLGV